MRKFYLKRLARTAFCLCLLHNLSWSCIPATAKQESLKASVSQTTEKDKLEALGIKSVIHVDTDRKQTIYVDSVRMGSKGFYKGVEAGDIVRGMAQKGNVFCLNIELMIDITGSMKLVDGTDGLTKFEWCHQQVSNLAQKLEPYLKNLTITTFNTEFNTEKNCQSIWSSRFMLRQSRQEIQTLSIHQRAG